MTRFMKYPDKGLKELGAEAINAAVSPTRASRMDDVEAAYVGNCAAGLVTGQESVRGQVILHAMGVGKIPIINVENACASGSTALIQACTMVSAGLYDSVLALGVEEAHARRQDQELRRVRGRDGRRRAEGDDRRSRATGRRIGRCGRRARAQNRSMFMDVYASAARAHMEKYGTTAEQFAMVASKNSFHGSMNPRAQFQQELSVEDVLNERMIVEPLTRAMCSPIGDGAAAAVVVSEKKAPRARHLEAGQDRVERDALGLQPRGRRARHRAAVVAAKPMKRRASARRTSTSSRSTTPPHRPRSSPTSSSACARRAKAVAHVASGAPRLGGRQPVNTSGGLLRKGHPVGATGMAQIVELTEQLQGRSGKRQVEGARTGMAQNGGGKKGNDAAAMVVTILTT